MIPNEHMKIESFTKGTVIFLQGEQDKILYKVMSGEVGIYSDYGGPREICLSIRTKNQCFGEMSILEDCPRSATAVAKTDVALVAYPESLMDRFVRQNTGFALELMRNLSEQLRNSTHELEKMHCMLRELTEQKMVSYEIQEYVRRHTAYTSEGAAVFSLKV